MIKNNLKKILKKKKKTDKFHLHFHSQPCKSVPTANANNIW